MFKMKVIPFILIVAFLWFTSCENNDFVYSYPELDKVLVSATRTYDETVYVAEFKYDSLNRVVEVKNIFPEAQVTVESYAYNQAGYIREKKIEDYTTTYLYNSDGKLVEQNLRYISSENDYEWNEKTEFKYKNGKISKGIEYSREGEIVNYISYKYDSNGNTLEKIVRPANYQYEFELIEIKFKYDNNTNPNCTSRISMLSGYSFTFHPDIVQINNPVYLYYMNAVMSSMPPEYSISYTYGPNGLPIKAEMKNIDFPEQKKVIWDYEYRDF